MSGKHPSERIIRWQRCGAVALAVVVVGLVALPARPAVRSPLDLPPSKEPRVAVGKSLSGAGFWHSQGVGERFERFAAKDVVYSRDLLLALPGVQADIEPNSRGVKITLFGNLPELSDSDALESAIVMHDTSAFDADLTLLRGRIVLTNTKEKGEAKVWLRTDWAAVQLTLQDPGDKVALEVSGRWAPGVPFSLKKDVSRAPVQLWDVYVLKGKMEAKAGKNEFLMAAPPGRAHFQGDNVNGPSANGPQPLEKLPSWADPKAPKPAILAKVLDVAATYRKILDETDEDEQVAALLAAAAKDKDKERAVLLRRLLVFSLAAADDVDEVVKLLNESKYDEIRKTAVVALRHWIGARAGRDEKLYASIVEDVGFSKAEAETVMQMLHSPFDPEQAETYETLIAYLKHRKQAIRELAHWHLFRLAPIGRKIAFDASAEKAARDKAADEWEKLIPPGTLPKAHEEKDEKKDKKDEEKKKDEK